MKGNFEDTLKHQGQVYTYYPISEATQAFGIDLKSIPYTYKIIIENLIRTQGRSSDLNHSLEKIKTALENPQSGEEIEFVFTRILLQDFTGVPVVADLAAMKDGIEKLGGNSQQVDPLYPIDLVIDHSVQVHHWKNHHAYQDNVTVEINDNMERYKFLKWGQQAFKNMRVVPPGTGICHQVNLEYLGKVVWVNEPNKQIYFDSLVGTDSHTTMINALSILGWGVGGIEAESAMLGRPISFKLPTVVGMRLTGQLPDGITGTDLVLTITEKLRAHGCVGKFVEFSGPGLESIDLAERATIANMAPEYGATCAYFPIDNETLQYLQLTNRDQSDIELIKQYAIEQDVWHRPDQDHAHYHENIELDLCSIKACVAGPSRPQDRVSLDQLPHTMRTFTDSIFPDRKPQRYPVQNQDFSIGDGDVMIAAITSCTNTSNPEVLITAGLMAKKAITKGLSIKPWVKPSFAPGSQVVSSYFDKLDLTQYMEKLGFYLVGYGCTTCIGNSGPLDEDISRTIEDHELATCAVLSGNRNFEGRIHSHIRANWLASPPLVIAYALAGTVHVDIQSEPLAHDSKGQPVFLKDLWPSTEEIHACKAQITQAMFADKYSDVFSGDKPWQAIDAPSGQRYDWDPNSTYIRRPTFFDHITSTSEPISDIRQANILAILGDSITTDHISPAGSIPENSPAGHYLTQHGIPLADFNTYGARRGNHEVMVRGTFANIRVRNLMTPEKEGGYTIHQPSQIVTTIYEASQRYQQAGTDLVVFAGSEYGTGSSRDWAAKGTLMLGVKAVICESFERIHRTNLIGMGVLPCRLLAPTKTQDLKLTGDETVDIIGIETMDKVNAELQLSITRKDSSTDQYAIIVCIETHNEMLYYQNQGILTFMLRNMAHDQPHT